MHYPWWYVPHLTSPMVIGLIATIHVLVSHYAVGGGLFLAVEVSHAHRTGNKTYLAYLKQHAWFFILITVVFGAITGVAIWWTIGLASPLATQVLIQTFIFGWAMEYCFFVLELASAFIFFYHWDRLKPETHSIIGWIYGISAWISLVLITGITAFMLNSGTWPEQGGFWRAFFNPQFIPQVFARTGGSLLLASMYVYFHASIWAKTDELKRIIGRRSARPALVGAVLILLGVAGWLFNLPEYSLLSLQKAPALNIFIAILFAVTVLVFVMLYIGPYRNPQWLNPGFGILFLMMGFAAVTAGEFVREAVRKPFIIHNVVMSNQILKDEIIPFRANGYLESGVWTRAQVQRSWPQVMEDGRVIEERLLDLPTEEQAEVGLLLFQHHCNDCHAIDQGLSAMRHLITGWGEGQLRSVATRPEAFQHYMPPFAGTAEEVEMLVRWMETIQEPTPGGLDFNLAESAVEGE